MRESGLEGETGVCREHVGGGLLLSEELFLAEETGKRQGKRGQSCMFAERGATGTTGHRTVPVVPATAAETREPLAVTTVPDGRVAAADEQTVHFDLLPPLLF